jgi:membrane peptidoglycan carboxypeptidase
MNMEKTLIELDLQKPRKPQKPKEMQKPAYEVRAKSKVRSHRKRQRRKQVIVKCILLILLFSFITFVIWDLRTSRFEAWLLSSFSSNLTYQTEKGPSESIRFPHAGPYDERMGYSGLQDYVDNLTERGFKVESQTRFSPSLMKVTNRGIFAIYREKSQAGLQIYDRDSRLIASSFYPQRVYQNFDSIPDIIVQTLLYIENRELLDERYPCRNPAVEWDRFAKALVDIGIQKVIKSHKAVGGSTMATQLEKYRHSPEGRTSEGKDKIQQMASASLRAYLNGEETLGARRQLVADYINSVPLTAVLDYGEVNGLGDGLWAWFGADFDKVNEDLASIENGLTSENLDRVALSYKQVLSLFIAHRRPTYFLIGEKKKDETPPPPPPALLNTKTNVYLKLLNKNGIISNSLMRAALNINLQLRKVMPKQNVQFVERKAANTVRTSLASILGVPKLYDLDRFDLTVSSSIDNNAQQEIVKVLQQLNDPEYAKTAGIVGTRLLGDKVSGVIYSFVLYEQVDGANLLRVQADNLDQPLNINEGVKLELGSTSKLRTLVTYLEIIAELHKKYSGESSEKLREALARVPSSDRLSQWGITYFLDHSDNSLKKMLESAMERRYSGNPGERFFTGGGSHTFVNFESWENSKMATVTEALQDSINLSFIRIMRDIVNYYTYQIPGSTARILEEPNSPIRIEYLRRFADKEGLIFLTRFYNKYKGKETSKLLDTMVNDVNPTLPRLAVIFRSVKPDASIAEFAEFMQSQSGKSLDSEDINDLYEKYSKSSYNLADRGYIARLHPLELWTVEYLTQHPGAPFKDLKKESAKERQAVYSWLFNTSRRHAQDIRIRTLIEIEAFQEVHKAWKRLGYPFDYLTPSYATAIGVSGDRPAALAELMGVIQNKGIRYPSVKMQKLEFAKNTPYETVMTVMNTEDKAGEQVIAPEIAEIVRKALINVVENGTAKRLNKAFKKTNGTEIAVGGKTGTGDNRRDIYGAKGKLVKSEVMSRTATFVFLIGDRFFGTLTAYVEGDNADQYKFTSSLPVQLVKVLVPKIMPLIEHKPVQPPRSSTTKNVAPVATIQTPATTTTRTVPATPVQRTGKGTQTPVNIRPPTTVTTPKSTQESVNNKDTESENTGAVSEYTVKVGTFATKSNADELMKSLKASGRNPQIRTEMVDDKKVYHIYIGKFKTSGEAKDFGRSLKENETSVTDYMIKEVPKSNQ